MSAPPYVANMGKAIQTIGYARVSTEEQSLDLQVNALEAEGCDRIITEKASGKTMNRQGLENLKRALRPKDTLVIWKLDRLGRDVRGMWEFIDWMNNYGVELKVLMEPIDTRSSNGRMLTTIFAALAQLERDQISERTRAGIEAKRAAGRIFGRQHSIIDNPKRLEAMRPYYESGAIHSMRPQEALRIMNAADRRTKAIRSLETFRRWRREGFKGLAAEPEEEQS